MNVTVETITPEKAREWLAMNSHNRNLKDSYTIRLAEAISRGEWELNGESIKLNGSLLIDGQHRLAAVVRAGVPIQSVVVRGIPLNAQETIDTGSRRTLSDILKLRGEGNYTNLASALTLLYRYQNGLIGRGGTRMYPTPQQAVLLLDEHPRLRDSLALGEQVRSHFRVVSGSGAAALHYIFSGLDPDDADDFFARLVRGTDLGEGHPILALRSSLEREATNASHRRTFEIRMAYFIKAWNAYREGREITLIKWNPGGSHPEAFPVPV